MESEIVDRQRVLSAEGVVGFADGLESRAHDWDGLWVGDFQVAIQGAFVLCCEDSDRPDLAFFAIEGIPVASMG